MLCSDPGSTRASTEVLSQIEATPGAVIAAQAVPDDCGRLPPLASFSESSSDVVAVPCRATVMSAPMRVSQNGEMDCLTDTAEVPFALSLADHAASTPAAAFDAPLRVRRRTGQGRRIDIEQAPVELADVDVLHDVDVVDAREPPRSLPPQARPDRRPPAAFAPLPPASKPNLRRPPASAAAPSQIAYWESLPARIPSRAQNAFALLRNYGADDSAHFMRTSWPGTARRRAR